MSPIRARVSMDLIKNAENSMNHAVEHLEEGGSNSFKYPILDTIHALELLFKEKLNKVNPAFVWQDVDKYPSINAKTVNIDTAINRLEKIVKIEFDEEKKITIKRLKKIRNLIQHYKFEINLDEAKNLIGKVISIIIEFSDNELNLDWGKKLHDYEKWAYLLEYYEFYITHAKKHEDDLREEGSPVTGCPHCAALTYNMKTDTCKLCGHEDEMHECQYCGESFFESENPGCEFVCESCRDYRFENYD